MTTATLVRRRRGFTLIELLVVVGIIVLLATLSAGTYFRIQSAEKVRATNATATKLNQGLDRKWKAILAAANDDAKNGTIPAAVMSLAGGDRDRARVIWTYFKLKNDLPTTFDEAKGEVCPNATQLASGDTRRGIWVWSPQNTANPAILVLTPRTIFNPLPFAGGTQEQQSAACLYLAMTASGNRGETIEGDGLGTQTGDAGIPGATLKAYTDAWDTPIAFSRMSFTPEVNTSDYMRFTPGVSRDPCDPTSRLVTLSTGWDATKLNDFWVRAAAGHISYVGAPAAYPQTVAATQNWVPTVISAGPNKKFETNVIPPNPPSPPIPLDLFAADSDNIVSFRLRREGNRGD